MLQFGDIDPRECVLSPNSDTSSSISFTSSTSTKSNRSSSFEYKTPLIQLHFALKDSDFGSLGLVLNKLSDFCHEEFSSHTLDSNPSKLPINHPFFSFKKLIDNFLYFLHTPTESKFNRLVNSTYNFDDKKIEAKIASLLKEIDDSSFRISDEEAKSWRTVTSVKRARPSSNSSDSQSNASVTSDVTLTSLHATSISTPSFSRAASVNSLDMETEPSDPAPPKPQAVLVKISGDWKTFITGINLALSAPATASLRPGDVVSLQTASESDHSKLLDLISQRGFEYSAPPPKSSRPRKVVIKGLPHTTSPEDIKSDLLARGFVASNIVKMLHRITRVPLNLFLVDIVPSDQFTKIFDISFMLLLKVQITAFKPGKRAAQCHACQRFGHHSFICNFRPRCVKCGEDHTSQKCDKPRTEPAKCANCAGRHTANYLGCPRNPINFISSKSARSSGRSPPGPQSKFSPPVKSSSDQHPQDARSLAISTVERAPDSGPARRTRKRRSRRQKKSFAVKTAAAPVVPPAPPSTSDITVQVEAPSSDLLSVIGEIRTLCNFFNISDILLLFSNLNAALLKATSPEEKLSAFISTIFTFLNPSISGAGGGSQ